MKLYTKLNFTICLFAVALLAACGNGDKAAPVIEEVTSSHIAGDTVKVTDSPDRFQAIGVDDPKIVNDFVAKVKTALEQNDKTTLAAMCTFPLRLNHQDGAAKSRHTDVKNAADFEKQFDKIFTAAAKTAIISQPNADLFANYQGLMLGTSGQAWAQYDADTKTIKIFSVNVGK